MSKLKARAEAELSNAGLMKRVCIAGQTATAKDLRHLVLMMFDGSWPCVL